MNKPVRFLSFFTGVGGLDLGLERAGMTCVGQVEIDPYCRAVLTKHWPNVPKMADVRDVRGDEFGPFDYLVGGFPCVDVSNAGKRAGISAPRSGLYGEIVRCLRVVRPLGAVLENVAALLARGMGRVLGDLAEIGYDAEWDCVPACAVGAPHVRDRVFVVAHSRGVGSAGQIIRWNIGRVRSWWTGCPSPLFSGPESWAVERIRLGGRQSPILGRGHGITHWMDRVRGLGNAVVPQVGEVVGRAITEAA